MTAPAKETLSRWLPAISCAAMLLLHVVAVSRWSATVDARAEAAEKLALAMQAANDARAAGIEARVIPLERLYELFPSRVEWVAQISFRNNEMADLKGMVRETNNKVDQLYQLQIRREAAR